jgi:DNA-binding CsgD family transcriptional regulator
MLATNTLHKVVSRREANVLWRVLQGMTDAEVSASMQISTATVQGHVRSLCRRMKVKSREGLIIRCIRLIP